MQRAILVILMGVSGSGKTTIGQLLAGELGWRFFDGDDFHPPANVQKMAAGNPLSDEDRTSWLAAVRNLMDELSSRDESAVIACSALKKSYREFLRDPSGAVRFVYLKGDYDLITSRLQQRKDHFMNPNLLASQFDTLEEPEDATIVDVAAAPEQIVASIKNNLNL